MKLNERFDVSPSKVRELIDRMRRLGIDPDAIEEHFTRGSGPGGRKVSTTSNAVLLRYPPLDLVVRCHRDRRRNVNRFLALRELVDRVEERLSPGTSKRLQEVERRRQAKARAARRARARHRAPQAPPETQGL
ncbi:MAG TPA: peptide chain release factor-like protein [Planctomycetota bacterium]|nr:peptide chain release factor-like protein [Planctomycetota bacterium]